MADPNPQRVRRNIAFLLDVRNDGMDNWEVTRDGTKVVEPLVELSSGKHTVIVRGDRPGK